MLYAWKEHSLSGPECFCLAGRPPGLHALPRACIRAELRCLIGVWKICSHTERLQGWSKPVCGGAI